MNLDSNAELAAIIVLEEWRKLDKNNAEYFREPRERGFGQTLEEIAENPQVLASSKITLDVSCPSNSFYNLL